MEELGAYLLPAAMIGVFYFMLIRPQQKKQKEQKSFAANLKKGQEIVTNSGLVGKITKLEDNFVTIQVGQKSYLKFLRGMVSKEMTELLPKIQMGEVVDTNAE